MQPRARDLGIEIGRLPTGPHNAITDVPGIRVGHTTLIEGEDVRTGVTVVVPPAEPLFAGAHRINGNGELTGLEWVRDSGQLTTPIGLTNTHSVGIVRDALVAAVDPGDKVSPGRGRDLGRFLNDINGFHVKAEHVKRRWSRRATARSAGAVGGASMVCHGSRRNRRLVASLWTVDGRRPRTGDYGQRQLRVNGAPSARGSGLTSCLPEIPKGPGRSSS